jgi:adenylate kinase
VIREDDKEKVIRDRMQEYDNKTRPLLQIFEALGVLINCEAKRGVKDYPEIKRIVEERIAKSG